MSWMLCWVGFSDENITGCPFSLTFEYIAAPCITAGTEWHIWHCKLVWNFVFHIIDASAFHYMRNSQIPETNLSRCHTFTLSHSTPSIIYSCTTQISKTSAHLYRHLPVWPNIVKRLVINDQATKHWIFTKPFELLNFSTRKAYGLRYITKEGRSITWDNVVHIFWHIILFQFREGRQVKKRWRLRTALVVKAFPHTWQSMSVIPQCALRWSRSYNGF